MTNKLYKLSSPAVGYITITVEATGSILGAESRSMYLLFLLDFVGWNVFWIMLTLYKLCHKSPHNVCSYTEDCLPKRLGQRRVSFIALGLLECMNANYLKFLPKRTTTIHLQTSVAKRFFKTCTEKLVTWSFYKRPVQTTIVFSRFL